MWRCQDQIILARVGPFCLCVCVQDFGGLKVSPTCDVGPHQGTGVVHVDVCTGEWCVHGWPGIIVHAHGDGRVWGARLFCSCFTSTRTPYDTLGMYLVYMVGLVYSEVFVCVSSTCSGRNTHVCSLA